MDQRIIYPGAVPQDTDLLLAQKYGKLGLGRLMDVLYGTTTAALGFAVTLSSTDLSVTLGTGIILTRGQLISADLGGEGGGISADGTQVMCQFLLENDTTLPFPGTGGTYTLYATCQDTDTDLTLLPFYNVAQPDQTQAGPNNSGNSLPVRRNSGITLSLGQSSPPAPVNGTVVPLMTFAVPAGATTGSAASYSQLSGTFWLTIPELQNRIAQITPGRRLSCQLITETGNYNIPVGAKRLLVRGTAGGGAGGYAVGGGDTSGATSAAGSGGGAPEIEFELDLTNPSFATLTQIPLVVGSGGVPGTTVGYSGSGTASSFNGGDITLNGGAGGYSGALTTGTNGSPGGYGGGIVYAESISSAYRIIIDKHGIPGNPGMNLAQTNWPGLGVGTSLGTGGSNSNAGVGESAWGYGASGGGGGSGYGHPDYLGGAGAPGCWIIEAYS